MSTDQLLQTPSYEDSLYNRKVHCRSSLDTFIIPNRTRFPSSKPKVPEELEFPLAKTLLSKSEEMEKPFEPGPRTSSQYALIPAPVPDAPLVRQGIPSGTNSRLPAGYDGPIDSIDQSSGTSTTWSTISPRVFTDSSAASDHRETSEFVKAYNSLATQHGLPMLVMQPKVDSRVSSVQSAQSSVVVVAAKPHWLLRKILRKSSSSYSVKAKAPKPLKPVSRRVSVADLPKRGRVDLLKDKSLEDLARLGGVSLFMLPTEFAATQLALPVSLCATAAYIWQHGRNMPGIFRISGQMSTINKVYDYYAQQIDAASKRPTLIRPAVSAALIPSHVSHNVHDVAAVFKKFLNALPGGILGSLSLFNALQSINKHLSARPDALDPHHRHIRARLIALAIASVDSQYRVSLICAVLGLVAVIGHETQAALAVADAKSDSDASSTAELMGYKGLGLVFAPLLIGDLTDEIELQPEREAVGVLSVSDNASNRRKDRKSKGSIPKLPGKYTFLDMSGERYKIVANVFEMLLINWTDIVTQLRHIGAMGGQPAIPEKTSQLAGEKSTYSLNVADDRLRAQSSADWEGSLKVLKKVTIRTSSPALFPITQASNVPDANNMRFESRESLTVGMKGFRQASSTLLSVARSITPALIEEAVHAPGETKSVEPAAVAEEAPVISDEPSHQQTAELVERDLPETARDPTPEPQVEASDPFVDPPAAVDASPATTEKQEAAAPPEAATNDPPAVKADAPQPAPASRRASAKSATHTRKTSAPTIAAAHAFACFQPGPPPPPTATSAPPRSPRAMRVGSVKDVVGAMSRTSHDAPARASDARRDAKLAVLARSGTVREAAQRFDAAPASAPASRVAGPPRASMIPAPVAPRGQSRAAAAVFVPRLAAAPTADAPSAHHGGPQLAARRVPGSGGSSGTYVSSSSRSGSWASSSHSAAAAAASNATLYAQIRRLERQLEVRTEELGAAVRELEKVRQCRDAGAGAMGLRLRVVLAEGRSWRERAEWAERRLGFGMGVAGGVRGLVG